MEFKLKNSSFICIHGHGRLPYNVNFSVTYLGIKFNDCLLVWLVGLWFSWGWSRIFLVLFCSFFQLMVGTGVVYLMLNSQVSSSPS